MAPHRGHSQTTAFPPGSHATATWTIPQDYGGMTSALLRRARLFVREAGAPVQILTFDPALDVPAARAELARRDELVDGITLHNVWEDLRELPDDQIEAPDGARPTATARAAHPGEFFRVEQDDDGRDAVHHHFRPDGSLAATDAHTLTGRHVTLYTRDGRPGRHWNSVWGVYRYWIRSVLPAGPAYVVVDSKSLVTFFAAFKRKETAVVHVVHGAHLRAGATDPHGPLTPQRATMVENFDSFDAVVFLTDGQRRDVLARLGPRANAFVIPNSTDLPDVPLGAERDVLRGAVLASLNGRKRVGQAIKAVRLAAERTGLPLHLDIYGDGPDRERLEKVAARTPGITMHGHVPGAADRLEEASFLLLTSRSEGLPLVFAEAMSRGCIPLAFDIRYGPADIVTDGVDGFLVPDGDTDALADAIGRFVTLDPADVTRMRGAAQETARGYSDSAIAVRWAELFEALAARQDRSSTRARRTVPIFLRRGAGMLQRAIRSARNR